MTMNVELTKERTRLLKFLSSDDNNNNKNLVIAESFAQDAFPSALLPLVKPARGNT